MYVFHFHHTKIIFAKIEEIIKCIDSILSTTFQIPSQIITLNLLIYLQSKFCHFTREAISSAKLIICDSAGISLCCSLFSFKLLKHQPGIELIEHICKLASDKGYKIYLLGSTQQVVEIVKQKLETKFCVNIVGVHHGFIFSPTDLTGQVIDDINSLLPDILFVGLPTEIQERWIYQNLPRLKCKIVIGIGGSFDVISGKLKRAPKFFRKLGLEWYFRLLQQPWRIARVIKLPLAFAFFIYDCFKEKLSKFNTKMLLYGK
ncbi:MAG: WecB/TagA/CpsF family glycosyltransferase [Endomicrobia bacterium]|nr:WecB/TagA/CpsF family glycosyltransferase [Endomicrobiia bacterium]